MKFINLENKRIAYQSKGRGPAIVLLHGFCEDSSIWDEFKTDLLEEKYRVICIDLLGFGDSDTIENASIEKMADIVAQVVDHLGLEQFILVGHSMGGYVSLAFAENNADKLLGLGLFHSQPFADSEEKKNGRQKSIDFIQQHGHILYVKQLIPKLFAEKFAKSQAFLVDKLIYRASKYQSAGIVNALKAMMQRPDRSKVLETFSKPVLFIIGKEDEAIPAENSIAQTHLPAQGSIHLLDKVGHMGMFEAKKQTQKILRQFVNFCLEQHKQ